VEDLISNRYIYTGLKKSPLKKPCWGGHHIFTSHTTTAVFKHQFRDVDEGVEQSSWTEGAVSNNQTSGWKH